MSRADQEKWDRRHSEPNTAPPRQTSAWLPAAGRNAWALDLACGQGRHIPRLLRSGYRVVAGDISHIALERVRRRFAEERHVVTIRADFDQWPFADRSFGAILMIDFFDRRLLSDLRRAVAVGGHLLIDTFLRDPRSGAKQPCNPDYLLEPGELDRVFADWRVVKRRSFERPARRDAILARRTA